MLGEVLFQSGQYNEAIVEFNKVLTRYFQHRLASLAQFRVGRCLDRLSNRLINILSLLRKLNTPEK